MQPKILAKMKPNVQGDRKPVGFSLVICNNQAMQKTFVPFFFNDKELVYWKTKKYYCIFKYEEIVFSVSCVLKVKKKRLLELE